jgi:hypothetical protein
MTRFDLMKEQDTAVVLYPAFGADLISAGPDGIF